MKKFPFAIALIVFLITSCSKDKITECTGDCLFALENVEGEMILLNCFERYGIKTTHPDDGNEIIYGIPESVAENFQVSGKAVRFSANFKPNTLTPSFPDPSFGPSSMYEIDLIKLEE